jgi:hypothetical protein
MIDHQPDYQRLAYPPPAHWQLVTNEWPAALIVLEMRDDSTRLGHLR